MKNRITFLAIIGLYISLPIQAQYNAIKLDLFNAMFTKQTKIGFERSFNKHLSGNLGFEIGRYQASRDKDTRLLVFEDLLDGPKYKVNGWGLNPELRVYPFQRLGPAPRGLFASIHYRFYRLHEHYYDDGTEYNTPVIEAKSDGYTSGGGLMAGYKNNFGSFVFEALCGFTYAFYYWDEPNERGNLPPIEYENKFLPDDNRLNYKVEFSVGFIFPKMASRK